MHVIEFDQAAAIGPSRILSAVALDLTEQASPGQDAGPATTPPEAFKAIVNSGRVAPVVPRWNGRAKRAADLLGSLMLLLFISPAFVLIASLIWISDGGPVLVSHVRIGRGGRSFRCLKFRSMIADAEAALARLLAEDPVAREEWATSRKLRNDPRVTRVGRVLRTTSLDELPQIINVLRGEMSLVGPRPVVADEIVEHYGADAAAYYLAVRPGITGLWQINGRSCRSYTERVAFDVDYARRMSPARDAAILLRTVVCVLSRRGAH